uniref:Uncharacterized protein n=1 Tax=Megaviridae environmental sample TaxID=1737588 RepID=A0A5J6VLI2_9VIRU|nr:MAG: hypothetical protein [Megaviridae environmental sample]
MELNCLNVEYINKISSIIDMMAFSSKRINVDEFDEKKYQSMEIEEKYVTGCANKYDPPRGLVIYNKNNKILFDCLNVQFMINNMIIPLIHTNLKTYSYSEPKENFYKVERSKSNEVQNCILHHNESIVYHKDKFKINVHFNEDKNTTIESYYTDLQKYIYLEDFLELNNIKDFNFIIQKIPEMQDNTLHSSIVKYYNKLIDDYTIKIQSLLLN